MGRRVSVNTKSAREFVAECGRFGVTPPAGIVGVLAALEVAQAMKDEVETPIVLAGMSEEEIRATVTRLSIARHAGVGGRGAGLQPGLYAIEEAAGYEMRDSSLAALDEMVVEMRPRFNAAAAPLVAAATDFGITLSTTADDVIEMDDEQAISAWKAARKAWDDLAPVVSFRRRINAVFQLPPTESDMSPRSIGEPNDSVVFAAGENWGLDDDYQEGSSLDWFAMAREGLRLNTPTEVAEKLRERRNQEMRKAVQAASPDSSVAEGRPTAGRLPIAG